MDRMPKDIELEMLRYGAESENNVKKINKVLLEHRGQQRLEAYFAVKIEVKKIREELAGISPENPAYLKKNIKLREWEAMEQRFERKVFREQSGYEKSKSTIQGMMTADLREKAVNTIQGYMSKPSNSEDNQKKGAGVGLLIEPGVYYQSPEVRKKLREMFPDLDTSKVVGQKQASVADYFKSSKNKGDGAVRVKQHMRNGSPVRAYMRGR